MPIREVTDQFQLEHIVPYFQPILDLQQSRVWRYECLARLVTAEDKTFLPNEFLYLIERNNHVQRLTETMFSQSARYFENNNVPWNLNLDAADIANPAVSDYLYDYLADYPNPSRVSVEISASTLMRDFDNVKQFIEQSVEHGLGVFIDNVGRTPVNIKKLLSLPIRGIKLAGGVLRQYDSQPQVQEFVQHLCELAQERSVNLVAEHIEDQTLLDTVTLLPIRYAQGFVFSRPVPAVPQR